MKKIKTFGIALLTACVLTACGGGGGGGGGASNTNNSSNATPVNPTHPSKPSAHRTGGVITASDNGIKHSDLHNNADFKHFIIVDGQKIYITKDFGSNVNIQVATWFSNKEGTKETHICCGSYEYVRFGLADEGEYKNSYFYYNGIPTKDLPTGKAKYEGHFILDANDNARYLLYPHGYYFGKANFDVDFAAKTLSGQFTHQHLQPIQVSATLKDNNFEGTATSPQADTKAKVEGKFYGPQAKELGGMFSDGKGWGGAFGAKKQ